MASRKGELWYDVLHSARAYSGSFNPNTSRLTTQPKSAYRGPEFFDSAAGPTHSHSIARSLEKSHHPTPIFKSKSPRFVAGASAASELIGPGQYETNKRITWTNGKKPSTVFASKIKRVGIATPDYDERELHWSTEADSKRLWAPKGGIIGKAPRFPESEPTAKSSEGGSGRARRSPRSVVKRTIQTAVTAPLDLSFVSLGDMAEVGEAAIHEFEKTRGPISRKAPPTPELAERKRNAAVAAAVDPPSRGSPIPRGGSASSARQKARSEHVDSPQSKIEGLRHGYGGGDGSVTARATIRGSAVQHKPAAPTAPPPEEGGRRLRSKEIGKVDVITYLKPITAIKINGNELTTVEGLVPQLMPVLSSIKHLAFLDLSFNAITVVDAAMLAQFTGLRVLHLHANAIGAIVNIKKLAQLESLRSLTLFENPIANTKGYRQRMIRLLPKLAKLDDIVVTPKERHHAEYANAQLAKRREKSRQVEKKRAPVPTSPRAAY